VASKGNKRIMKEIQHFFGENFQRLEVILKFLAVFDHLNKRSLGVFDLFAEVIEAFFIDLR